MKKGQSIRRKFVLGAVLVNLIWLALSLVLPSHVLISPVSVYPELPRLLGGSMGLHLLASLYRLGVAVPASMVLGCGLALVMSQTPALRRALDAVTYLAYPIPKVALLPVVILIAGLGDAGKMVMIVLVLLFQFVVATRDSLSAIPREYFMIAGSLGAGRLRLLADIVLPGILPAVFSALRIAVGTSVSVLFVTETYGTAYGMGYFIVDAWMRFDYVDMYGGILVLSIIGFCLFVGIDYLESRCCRWTDAAGQKSSA